MDDIKLMEAADAYESERERWFIRRNKSKPVGSQWEVVQGPMKEQAISDKTLIVHASCYDEEVADYEKDEQRNLASMKAALYVLNGQLRERLNVI